eukprot:GFUD01092242.1.p1 GENE.GFUD01092242.1~~GFUD01092242.1.p1  ORF type:complete len:117 (-),score=36.33 GFUD01092242.1:14-364(-)
MQGGSEDNDKNNAEFTRLDKNENDKNTDEIQLDEINEESKQLLKLKELDNEKQQILEDLEKVINKKESITFILAQYKVKRKDMLDPEKNELIIETEEKLVLIDSSIASLIYDLKQF